MTLTGERSRDPLWACGLPRVFSRTETARTRGWTRETDSAGPERALRFKRARGSPLRHTAELSLSFKGAEHGPFFFIVSALSTMSRVVGADKFFTAAGLALW